MITAAKAIVESRAVSTKDLVTRPAVWPRAVKNSNAAGSPNWVTTTAVVGNVTRR